MYMKKLFLLISFFSIVANAQTARGVKIGYIDMEYILEKVPNILSLAHESHLDLAVQR